MNHDPSQTPREELELKLTALLLGELPPTEAAALLELIRHDRELSALHEQLKQTLALVRETAAGPVEETAPQPAPLKLSEGRRQKLLAHFKTVQLQEITPKKRRMRFTVVELAAVLAIAAVLAAMMLPALSKSKERSTTVVVRNNLRQLEGAKAQWALEHGASADAAPTLDDLKPYLGRGDRGLPTVADESYVIGKVGEPVAVEVEADRAKRLFRKLPAASAPNDAEGQRVRMYADGRVAFAPEGDALAFVPEGNAASFSRSLSLPKGGAETASSTPPPAPPAATPPARTPILLPGQDGVSTFNGAAGAVTLGGSADSAEVRSYLSSYDGAFHQSTRGVNPADGTSQHSLSPALQDAVDSSSSVMYGFNPAPAPQPPQSTIVLPSANSLEGSAGNEPLQTRTFKIDPNTFYQGLESVSGVEIAGTGSGGGGAGGFGGNPSAFPRFGASALPRVRTGSSVAPSENVSLTTAENRAAVVQEKSREFFNTLGVNLADSAGKDISFNERTGELTVRATAGEMEVVEAATQTLNMAPPQVNVKARFSEVAPTDEKKPEFGWYAGSGPNDQRGIDQSETALGLDLKNRGTLSLDGNALRRETVRPDGLFDIDGDKLAVASQGQVPILGDVPLLGHAFKSEEKATAAPAPELAKAPSAGRSTVNYANFPAQSAQKDVPADKGAVAGAPIVGYFTNGAVIGAENLSFGAKTFSVVPGAAENLTANSDHLAGARPGISGNSTVQDAVRRQEERIVALQTPKTGNQSGAALLAEAHAEVMPLRYAKASEVAQALEGIAQVSADKEGNLVVIGDQATLKQIRQTVEKLDAPAGQVLNELALAGAKAKAVAELDPAPAKPPVPLPVPQPEILTAQNAFSTFSLNVSDVSFKLAAASLEKGQMPDPAGIRSEEFINAFDYRDPEASGGAPIAFATERARYPFAYNRDLLRFSVKTAAAGRQAGRPMNIVLLLDNSGSMERADRVRIIQQALRVLASQLQPQDKLSVVTFSRTPRLWVDGRAGNQAGEIAEGLSGLTPEGGTNLEEALNLAYTTALRHYVGNGINRVVLLTDGAANLGNVQPAVLKQKVEINRRQGVALDCFGIGWEGYNDDLLEVLSRNGDGRYGFINSPEEAATEFAGQLAGALKVAASDVKVQVEFNPKRVTSYRQIGYAKHQLTKQQFRDNTVDAAEIAAQEAGNALYSVEVNPAGEGPVGTVRVRYKVPGTTDYREQEWTVPYTGNSVSLDQASSAMRLAATASAFSEWLATSPFAGEVTTDKLLGYLRGVPAIYGADARPQKLEWMIRQAKSISGK